MGTNYYLRKKANFQIGENPFLNNSEVTILSNGYVFQNKYYSTLAKLNKVYFIEYHIGKDSYGWKFLLSTYPAEGIKNLNDWMDLFDQGIIYNDYDEKISKNKMIDIIQNKSNASTLKQHQYGPIIDNTSYDSYDIYNGSDFS